MKQSIITKLYHSPYGALMLGETDGKLCLCDWLSGLHHERVTNRLEKALNASIVSGESRIVNMAAKELDEYFANVRQTFDIPLSFVGTDFQKKVWHALQGIPYGKTVSYGQMARTLGCPRSVRAVANAVGANPISVIVPCHRVVGSDGSLTGYAGGIETKRHLLQTERRNIG